MKRKLLFAFLTIGSIVTADVITKRLAEALLPHGYPIERLGIPLTLAYNTGVAFGLPLPSLGRWLVVGATLFVLFVLVGIFRRTPTSDWLRLFAVQLVGAGAIGNLIDRLRYGMVVDFLLVHVYEYHWPAFNVADSAISVGVTLMVLDMFLEWRREKRKTGTETANER